jgi:hypothetical protein
MAYRIACIYVEEQSSLKEVRLEVCNDGTSTQIAPFVRKATVADLAKDENILTRNFALLLNGLGFVYQPFVLNGRVLENPDVGELLKRNGYNFIQSGGSRSLKKGNLPLIVGGAGLDAGMLLGGTLYITNLANWKSGIEVRLCYQDAVTEVLPYYNTYPIRTLQGGYLKRDAWAE